LEKYFAMCDANWLIGSPAMTHDGIARLTPPGAKRSRMPSAAHVAGRGGPRPGGGERVDRLVALGVRAAGQVGAEVGGLHDPEAAAPDARCSRRCAQARRGSAARAWRRRMGRGYGLSARMGRSLRWARRRPAGRSLLRVPLPRPADVRVLRDGAVLTEAGAMALDVEIAERGDYRVEARIGGRLWLLSNPVHLR
jgi:hypothetical protein